MTRKMVMKLLHGNWENLLGRAYIISKCSEDSRIYGAYTTNNIDDIRDKSKLLEISEEALGKIIREQEEISMKIDILENLTDIFSTIIGDTEIKKKIIPKPFFAGMFSAESEEPYIKGPEDALYVGSYSKGFCSSILELGVKFYGINYLSQIISKNDK